MPGAWLARGGGVRRVALGATLGLALLCFGNPASSRGAELSFADCIESSAYSSADDCPDSAPGLKYPTALAVSPSGRQSFALDAHGSAVTSIRADAAGKLVFEECVSDTEPSADGDCGTHVPAMTEVKSVAMSPAGEHLYVGAEYLDYSVVSFRNTVGGLQHLGCISGTWLESTPCQRWIPHFYYRSGLAVSQDGRTVYAGAEQKLFALRRSSSGNLRKLACYGCREPTPLGSLVDGISDLEVSGDGRYLFATAITAQALTVFRIQSDGRLRFVECFIDHGAEKTGHVRFCPQRSPYLDHASGVATNGRYVYVSSRGPMSVFKRTAGRPGVRRAGCISVTTPKRGCRATLAGVGPLTLDSVPGTRRLVGRSASADTLFLLARLNRGRLRRMSCVTDLNSGSFPGCSSGLALTGPGDVEVTGRGDMVFTSSGSDSSVASFLLR